MLIKNTHPNVSYYLVYHLVFVTKYRRRCISEDVFNTLKHTFSSLSDNWEVSILNIAGDSDHIHLELSCHPNLNLSKLVNSFKTVTSRVVRRDHNSELLPFLKKGLWSRSYYISSVGLSNERINKYLTDNHHKF